VVVGENDCGCVVLILFKIVEGPETNNFAKMNLASF
jgi:hypothetical protein